MSAAAAKALEVALEVGKEVLPDLIAWVVSLIKAGKTPAEAREIIRRDIQSRRAEYEAAKAEDEQRLAEKHRLSGDNPFGES